jgi:hypothetical protein
MPISRLTIAKRDIVKAFQQTPAPVFTTAEIDKILATNRAFWRLAKNTTVNKFIAYLLDQTPLKAIRFNFPNRPTTRYTWGEVHPMRIAQSLKPEGYFSHYTAMQLHGLTEQIPKTIYLNFEQDMSGGGGKLTQGGIDRAFKSKPRVSNSVAPLGDLRVCLLNGRNTGKLGVVEIDADNFGKLRVTNVERTLIDAAVRPVYSGGVFEVAQAYKMGQQHVSINKLVAYLKQLEYTYPYHQAIGFYLERSGAYKQSQVDMLRQCPMEFDFYLANRMGATQYNEKWRLFIPNGF